MEEEGLENQRNFAQMVQDATEKGIAISGRQSAQFGKDSLANIPNDPDVRPKMFADSGA